MSAARASGPVAVERLEDGAVWRVVLDAPKGNILDGPMVDGLRAVAVEAAADASVKALVLEGAGAHFSFGASVQEHLPDQVEEMLARFHGLFRQLLEAPVVLLAAVRGQCLGGGLELAAFCNRVFAAPGAKLGQPEVVLGALAPIASTLLVDRVGRGAAEDLCLSGRSLDAMEALRIRLVDELADDPTGAALAYARAHLLPRSAACLRLAARAVRQGLRRRFQEDLPAIERIYLDELMRTDDAVEGLRAFLEKRPPAWRDR